MITRDMTETERAEYCRRIVQEQTDSGLTVNRWCKENNMPRARFYRYKRYAELCHPEVNAVGNPLDVKAGQRTISIEACGVRIVLDEDADLNTACRVIRALQES